ncbi:MAG TPA: exodeoxyribonuclease VII large subunit [Bacteroidales bacterium]|nr:exodeoxyribonuclease VII large subunit [Bacteroidales bacterium]
MEKHITLCELLGQVKATLKSSLPNSWWVIAEISEIKVNFSGHCYLELIEKNEETESIKAKVRATIWSSVYRMLQPYFETSTRMTLCPGIKVMLKVNAEFHELYGFSLNITDIEPSYTLGELAQQKQQIINRLITEGVFEMNRSLSLPAIPARIAVISSKTAAGFGDFMDQLMNNPFGYQFYLKLFPAAVQGNEAEQSIIKALDRIYSYDHFFDVVVIIRGGGSQSDLHCFNSYWLNYNICQFPIPILTGIGHEQDETIADLVAFKRLKTPTAVAEYLIDCFRSTEQEIAERSESLYDLVNHTVQLEKERLNNLAVLLKPSVKQKLQHEKQGLLIRMNSLNSGLRQMMYRNSADLKSKQVRMKTTLNDFIRNKKHEVELLEKKNSYLDPFLILQRGYSITYHNGKAVKDPSTIKTDEMIETRLAGGTLKSKTL